MGLKTTLIAATTAAAVAASTLTVALALGGGPLCPEPDKPMELGPEPTSGPNQPAGPYGDGLFEKTRRKVDDINRAMGGAVGGTKPQSKPQDEPKGDDAKDAERIARELLKLIEERSKQYAGAEKHRDDYLLRLRKALANLEAAANRFRSLALTEETIQNAIKNAEKWEDILGLGELGLGIGLKVGTSIAKKILASRKLLDAAKKSPELLLQLRRLLSAEGNQLPKELLERARALDRARLEAVASVVNGRGLAGKIPLPTGSAGKIFKEVDGRWVVNEAELDKAWKAIERGETPHGWKGLASDLDANRPNKPWRPSFGKEFDDDLARETNASLRSKGFDTGVDPGKLGINIFDRNLSHSFPLDDVAGYEKWALATTDPKYLANPTAWRNYGAQKFARVFEPGGAVKLSKVDGADVVHEMRAQAYMYERGAREAGALSDEAYKGVVKAYERSLVGARAMGSPNGLVIRSVDKIDDATALRDPLSVRDQVAKALASSGDDYAVWNAAKSATTAETRRDAVRRMLHRLDDLAGQADKVPYTGVPRPRELASRLGRGINTREAAGVFDGASSAIDLGLKEARRQLAEQLSVPSLYPVAAGNKMTGTLLGGSGVLGWIGNWKTRLIEELAYSYLDFRSLERARETSMGTALVAAEDLIEAERALRRLQRIRLDPPDDIRARMNAAVAGLSESARACVTGHIEAALNDLESRYAKLRRLLDRAKAAGDLTRDEMVDTFKGHIDYDGIVRALDEARRGYFDAPDKRMSKLALVVSRYAALFYTYPRTPKQELAILDLRDEKERLERDLMRSMDIAEFQRRQDAYAEAQMQLQTYMEATDKAHRFWPETLSPVEMGRRITNHAQADLSKTEGRLNAAGLGGFYAGLADILRAQLAGLE